MTPTPERAVTPMEDRTMPFAPTPAFGDPCGPWRRRFAWWPTRMFDGTRIWLRRYWRRRIQKHDYLPGGRDFWWQNTDWEKPDA